MGSTNQDLALKSLSPPLINKSTTPSFLNLSSRLKLVDILIGLKCDGSPKKKNQPISPSPSTPLFSLQGKAKFTVPSAHHTPLPPLDQFLLANWCLRHHSTFAFPPTTTLHSHRGKKPCDHLPNTLSSVVWEQST